MSFRDHLMWHARRLLRHPSVSRCHVCRIAAGGLVSWRASMPYITITCIQGRAWITREGDPTDYLLYAQRSVVVPGIGKIVVQPGDGGSVECLITEHGTLAIRPTAEFPVQACR